MPDSSVYYTDNPFPETTYDFVSVQKKCGVSIAYINIYPVTYYPLSGRVVGYYSLFLKVVLKESSQQPSPVLACYPERVYPERMGIENPEVLETYTPEYCQQIKANLPVGGICDPAETAEYVIITNEVFRDATGIPRPLSFLIEWREVYLGLTVEVVTIEEILANDDYNYGDHGGEEAEDDCVRVRNFIREAYNDWETEYVLIIGTPSSSPPLPMRKLYTWCGVPGENKYINVFSDLYYQCIHDPYDFNDNDLYGEAGIDGVNGGEVDLTADVFIGRVYAETKPEDMSFFIDKAYRFENDVINAAPYTNNSLFAGEYLAGDVWGKHWMEPIRIGSEGYGYKTFGFKSSYYMESTADKMYDSEGSWNKNEMKAKFNSNAYCIINHTGHGSVNGFMKLVVGSHNDIDDLTNTNPLFIYSQACWAGYPGGIGRNITSTTEYGAWGSVLNTHFGLTVNNVNEEDPGNKFHRRFWNAYFYKGLFNVGAMNACSHEDNLSLVKAWDIRWLYYVTTLIGDPYTFFRDPIPCERNLYLKTLLGYNDVLARELLTAEKVLVAGSITKGTFVSGKKIRLLPGFNAYGGAEFRAFIDPVLYKSDCE